MTPPLSNLQKAGTIINNVTNHYYWPPQMGQENVAFLQRNSGSSQRIPGSLVPIKKRGPDEYFVEPPESKRNRISPIAPLDSEEKRDAHLLLFFANTSEKNKGATISSEHARLPSIGSTQNAAESIINHKNSFQLPHFQNLLQENPCFECAYLEEASRSLTKDNETLTEDNERLKRDKINLEIKNAALLKDLQRQQDKMVTAHTPPHYSLNQHVSKSLVDIKRKAEEIVSFSEGEARNYENTKTPPQNIDNLLLLARSLLILSVEETKRTRKAAGKNAPQADSFLNRSPISEKARKKILDYFLSLRNNILYKDLYSDRHVQNAYGTKGIKDPLEIRIYKNFLREAKEKNLFVGDDLLMEDKQTLKKQILNYGNSRALEN